MQRSNFADEHSTTKTLHGQQKHHTDLDQRNSCEHLLRLLYESEWLSMMPSTLVRAAAPCGTTAATISTVKVVPPTPVHHRSQLCFPSRGLRRKQNKSRRTAYPSPPRPAALLLPPNGNKKIKSEPDSLEQFFIASRAPLLPAHLPLVSVFSKSRNSSMCNRRRQRRCVRQATKVALPVQLQTQSRQPGSASCAPVNLSAIFVENSTKIARPSCVPGATRRKESDRQTSSCGLTTHRIPPPTSQ